MKVKDDSYVLHVPRPGNSKRVLLEDVEKRNRDKLSVR